MQNDKNHSKCSNIFIQISIFLSRTACIYVSTIMHIYAHTSESTIKFCDARGGKRPPGNTHRSTRTLYSSNSLVPCLFLIFLVSVQILPPHGYHLPHAILVAFLHLLFSITSLVFISFICCSHHHHIQFSCLFIYWKVVCISPALTWSFMTAGTLPCWQKGIPNT